MYIKVFPHGKGSGGGAVNYLTRLDYPGRQENPPEVLRGDSSLTRALIDSQDRVWKFSAGVLSWGPEDNVTPEQERHLMDAFEATAFSGLEPDQYAILWVRHSHAGHHELHFVLPRMELYSGKALNPFPPGWQKDFDVLRDLYNWREDWTRPDDPERARVRTPDHADLNAARLRRWGQQVRKDDRTKARDQITNYLVKRIASGVIKNREDLIAALTEIGLRVPRQGKDYITIQDEDGQRVRLKGGIYCETWRLGQQNQRTTGAGSEPSVPSRDERVADLAVELERIDQRRADYHRSRYPQPERGIEQKRSFGGERHRIPVPTVEQDHVQGVGRTVSIGDGLGSGRLYRDMVPDIERSRRPEDHAARAGRTDDHENRTGTHSESTGKNDMGSPVLRGQERTFSGVAQRDDTTYRLDTGQENSDQIGVNYERNADIVSGHTDTMGTGNEYESQRIGRSIQTQKRTVACENVRTRSTANGIRRELAAFELSMHGLETVVATLEQHFKIVQQRESMREQHNSHDSGYGFSL